MIAPPATNFVITHSHRPDLTVGADLAFPGSPRRAPKRSGRSATRPIRSDTRKSLQARVITRDSEVIQMSFSICFKAMGSVGAVSRADGADRAGVKGTLSERQSCLSGCSGARPPVYRSVLMIAFVLSAASSSEAENGLASYYGGRGHHGEMTCAHRARPFGSIVTVTYAGHSIRWRVNDRGPFVRGRVIDVSLSAARALGMTHSGVVRVSVE